VDVDVIDVIEDVDSSETFGVASRGLSIGSKITRLSLK
jgi:hypothetical protein